MARSLSRAMPEVEACFEGQVLVLERLHAVLSALTVEVAEHELATLAGQSDEKAQRKKVGLLKWIALWSGKARQLHRM
eukprot:4207623-Lingulodinium_polyedra.AAC.1